MLRNLNGGAPRYKDYATDSEDEYEINFGSGKLSSSAENVTTAAGNELVIEKILGRRFVTDKQGSVEELYLIKWKSRSFLHITWERREDLEAVDPQGKVKIKRFLQTPQLPGVIGSYPVRRNAAAEGGALSTIDALMSTSSSSSTAIQGNGEQEKADGEDGEDDEDEDIEYFNPELVEVQRIISCESAKVSHARAKTPHALLRYVPGAESAEDDAADRSLRSLSPQARRQRHHHQRTNHSLGSPSHASILHDKVYSRNEAFAVAGDSKDDAIRAEVNDATVVDADPDSELKYLVKWRGLPYNECSWERWADIRSIGFQEVWKFWQLQKAPKIPAKFRRFPTLGEYHKLEVSPVFGLSKDDHLTQRRASREGITYSASKASLTSLGNGNKDDEGDEEEAEFEEGSAGTEKEGPRGGGADAEASGLQLRDYQLEGVNWLLWNWWHKRPCILADEMGLGKTIQTVAFLHQLRFMKTTRVSGPFLIIAPLSLVDQWLSEVNTWSPDMNCVLLHGNAAARETIINNEFYFKEPFTSRDEVQALKKRNVCKFNILLSTYEIASKEIRALCKIDWQVVIIDEAHKLKNASSKLFASLNTIPRQYCVLLTGTPLQNKTEELWALLNFADSARFRDMEGFLRNFGDLKDSAQVARLHDMLKPYLLRRIKEDVEKSLPPKEETIIEVSLTTLQKKFYRAIYEKNTLFLYRGLKSSNQPSLMNVMMELRKCCNHPYLVRGVEERVVSELPAEHQHNEEELHKKLVESSGKLVLLDKLLPRLKEQGHKVLIFSQMVRVLNLLEDFLNFKRYTFERLDGSTRSSDRKDAVARFCKPSQQKFIMLMSTKAGGLGLNLTAADTVIIFDSDWNPQNDLQAQARAHRIGQTKAVMVYRLLTRKTYEMEMFHQASMKLGLDRAVLAHARNEQDDGNDGDFMGNPRLKKRSTGSGGSSSSQGAELVTGKRRRKGAGAVDDGDGNDDGGGDGGGDLALATGGGSKPNMSAKEIDELLKRGAYDVFREDDTEQREFEEADIDAILQRNARKVTYGDGPNASISSSLGSFSKASFVSADEKESVDINDPDFWRKAVGLDEKSGGLLDEPGKEDEVLPFQRVRKQTKNYGDEAHVSEQQLNDLLKPFKPEKTALLSKKKLQLKERQEREEARQQRLAAEAAARNDPSTWGGHTRDKILRTLNQYGFSRWVRIEAEASQGTRDPSCIESFARLYIYQLGLIAGEQQQQQSLESGKKDSTFVVDAIESARKVQQMVLSGDQTLQMPPCLLDAKFHTKLRTGGLAKKTLMRMEALAGLVSMIQEMVETAHQRREAKEGSEPLDLSLDLDSLFAALSFEEQLECLPLGDVRPSWSRPRSWWDLECDRHLVLGTFKHGYGRYELMRDDPDYCFKEKLVEEAKGMIAAADQASADKASAFAEQGVDAGEGNGVSDRRCAETDMLAERAETGEADEAGEDEAEGEVSSPARSRISTRKSSARISASNGSNNGDDGDKGAPDEDVDDIDGDTTGGCSAGPQSAAGAFIKRRGRPPRGLVLSRSTGAVNNPESGDGSEGGGTAPGGNGNGDGADDDTMLLFQGATSAGSSGNMLMLESGSSAAPLMMPDARALNRLFAWLVCSETARASEAEINERKRKERERKAAAATARKAKQLEIERTKDKKQGDMDGESSATCASASAAGLKSCVEGKRMASSTPSLGEAFQGAERLLLSKLYEIIDVEAFATVFKAHIQGMQTCELVLNTPTGYEEALPEVRDAPQAEGTMEESKHGGDDLADTSASEQAAAAHSHASSSQDVVNMDVAEHEVNNGEADSGEGPSQAQAICDAERTASAGLQPDTPSSLRAAPQKGAQGRASAAAAAAAFTDDDATRLSAALILFGAPVPTAAPRSLLPRSLLHEIFGLPTQIDADAATVPVATAGYASGNGSNGNDTGGVGGTDSANNTGAQSPQSPTASAPAACAGAVIPTFTWEHLLLHSRIDQSVQAVENFYEHVWLPFCTTISTRRTLSTAQHKYKVPNPKASPSQHHLAARGLCQWFLVRQQVRSAVHFLLCERLPAVLQYLRANPFGRSTTHMPVWWCPWIHDMGLLLGVYKHGFISPEIFVADIELPFESAYLERHIRKVFFSEGAAGPFGTGMFTSKVEEDAFLDIAMLQFPGSLVLEQRLIRIVEDLTYWLSPQHPLRVRSGGLICKSPTALETHFNTIVARHVAATQAAVAGTGAGSRPAALAPYVSPPIGMTAYSMRTAGRRRKAVEARLPGTFSIAAAGAPISRKRQRPSERCKAVGKGCPVAPPTPTAAAASGVASAAVKVED